MTSIPATSVDELRAIIRENAWFTNKVPTTVIDDFFEHLKFRQGKVAHMDYGKIGDTLSGNEFIELLVWLGVERTFYPYRNMTCVLTPIDTHRCSGAPNQYCDPAVCN
jgi:hypothetical protein